MRRFLEMLKAEFEEEFILPNAGVVDFFVPKENLLIEVDGLYWHSKRKARDRRVEKMAKELGYLLVRVPEAELDEKKARQFQRKHSRRASAV